jgi:hypothetical protein
MYKVYFTNEYGDARSYDEEDLVEALRMCEVLRKQQRYSFITMVSENPDSIGKAGVDSVTDGRLPDGSTYEWMKRRSV